VSILTLLFLLTGTIHPMPSWWTSYDSHPLGVLEFAGDTCRSGHPPSTTNDSASHHHLPPIRYAEPGRIVARLTSGGDTTAPSVVMRRPSRSGPASLVDSTLSLLVQVRMPDSTRDAQCIITSGITLTRRLESAGMGARVQLWSLAEITSGEGYRSQREAHVWSFDVRPGETPVQRSAEFACPPPQSLQTFEVSCADGDGECSVEVWQGLFRVEIRA